MPDKLIELEFKEFGGAHVAELPINAQYLWLSADKTVRVQVYELKPEKSAKNKKGPAKRKKANRNSTKGRSKSP